MRKLISIWMTCTLLLITTLPTASWAAMCEMPSADSSNLEAMAHMQQSMHHQKHSNKPMHIMHHNHALANGDWQTCRIECGCGCHRHLDSLPHLLSPHIVAQTQALPNIKAPKISIYYITSSFYHTLKVAVPPPNLS